MKTKCSFILKACTALVLCFLMLFGTVTTSLAAVVDNLAETGASMNHPYVYFDGSNGSWNTTVYFWVGNGNYCKRYTMSKVANTDYLWYVEPGDVWNDANYYAFVWGYDNLGNGNYNGDLWKVLDQVSNTNNKTGQKSNYNLNYHETYTFRRASNWYDAPEVSTGVTKSQTAKVYTSGTNSGTGGTVQISAYYPTYGSTTTTNSTTATTAASPNVTYDAATVRTNTTFTATAATGYNFDGFYDAATGGSLLSSSTTYTHRVSYSDSSYTVYARFSPKTYTITYNKGANGTGTVASTTKTHGTNATLSSSTFTRTGYTQDGWSTSDGGAKAYDLGGSYTTNADITLYPHWSQNTHTVSRSGSAPSNGTIKFSTDNSTWSDGPITVAEGGTYYVKATPSTGYKINSFSVGGSAVSGASGSTTAKTYTGTMGSSDVTATASFAIRTINVKKTETGASGGTVKVGSTTIGTSNTAVNYGTGYTVTVAAPDGYIVSAVSGVSGTTTGLDTENVTITGVSITADKTIAVTYVSAGRPSLATIADVSKNANTTTFNVTATINDEDKKTGTLTATASSSDTTVATVGSPTVSGSTVTIPVTIKGKVDSSTISVTLKDGGTDLNTQTFSVSMTEPTLSFANKDIYVSSSAVDGGTITNGGVAPSSISYTSSNTEYITVGASNGKLTAAKVPTSDTTATITATATYASGYKKTATYTATLKAPSLTASSTATSGKIGDTATGSCSGSYPSLSTSTVSGYSWSSSDSNVVAITNNTTATPTFTFKKNGSATITLTVTYKTGLTKTATKAITVNAPTVSFSDTSAASINVGGTVKRTATPGTIGSGATGSVAYSGTNQYINVASDGTVTGLKPTSSAQTVTATYTVTCGDQTSTATATYTVTVKTPTVSLTGNAKVAVGDTITLTPSVTNVTGTPTYTYSSSADSKASVNNSGVVTGVATGSATITVTATLGDWSGTTTKTITVESPSLTVKDGSTSIANGTVYLTAGGTAKTITVAPNFSDTLYVKSKNTLVATVSPDTLTDNTFTITPLAKGTTKISVSTSNIHIPTRNIPETVSILPERLITKQIEEIAATGAVTEQTVEFTANVAEADTNKYLYFTNGVGWSGVKAYLYGDGSNASFPGEAMVKIGKNEENKDVYAIRYPATKNYTNVIISKDGEDGTRVKYNNTTDLPMPSNNNNAYWANDTDGDAGQWNCTIVKPQITANDVTIDMGSTQTMTATVLTSGTPSTFNWSSGTTSVATTADTHTASNVITGVAPGNSTITIKAYADKTSDFKSIVTDGTADDFVAGTTTATATVVAENKTVTFGEKYTNDGTAFSNGSGHITAKYYDEDTSSGSGSSGSGSSGSGSGSGSGGGESGSGTGYTGEGTTMTSPQSVPYGKIAVFTAQATYTSGTDTYAFAEWVDGSNNTLSKDLEYAVKITEAKTVHARYYKVFKLSAFDSYEKVGSSVNFVTAPPKVITVKHGADTYTYNFDGTAPGGHPGTPDDPQATYPDPLPVNSGGTYGQGNYIQYLAGDEITLIYSAMASSETFKGVFYNNSVEYYLAKPSAENFFEHDYAAAHTLYMNSAYYEAGQVPSGLPSTTVDPDAHSIKFTGTQDYKNIDVEVGTKRKVYFSDYTNAVIGSKNTDDYYSDGEALSVTGDQLTVKAAKSSTQTNIITADAIRFYKANADGTKGEEVSKDTLGITITGTSSTSTASADGDPLVFNGNMPSYDLYIELNMTNNYTIKLGSKVMADPFESKTRLAQIATVSIKEGSTTKLSAPSDHDVSQTSTSVNTGTALTLSTVYTGSWSTYYTFVGWYWGDDSAPNFDSGFISNKETASYTPKKGGTIWAVGTRSLYINGSKYITGKDTNWYGENSVQKNLPMSYDAESGRYYWEITDTMFTAAGSNYKTWLTTDMDEKHNDYGVYFGSSPYYWTDNSDTYHGKSFFQIFDAETGDAKTVWDTFDSFRVDTPSNGPTYGKIYPRDYTGDDYYKRHDGQGFINFNESGSYAGQSSPLRIYFDPSKSGTARLTVESTKIYSNIYVSNGFTVGSTLRTSNVTVEPVVDGVVKTSGQTGFFDVGKQGDGWDPDNGYEGHVNHYKPQKKGATVRITKTAGGSDKIEAFFIYDITNKTVRAERDVKNSGSNYYIDLTLANEEQNLYIVPIVEEAGANVTISFDATQLNRAQWGDIVTAYAWYSGSGGNALGAYPGQPMIPSDDMTTWTTTFKGTNANNDELQGITFSNYVDGKHTWLGCSGVMGTVSNHETAEAQATGGIINVYNHIDSGSNHEYARTNFKAQTYDYREPIALYDRFKSDEHVTISFSMKDGNSSLISWQHSQLLSHNIVTLEPHPNWDKLNWEYLTNAKGDKYIDMNGNTMKTKPTASFYVAAKGQVLYNNSSMTNVFYSGKQYDPVSGVTYGAASGIGMNYAVQWYVYDASGNYITNVLTAGIADLASNNVDSYIGKRLEDMGYAVDGKSVAICYDKPRYMYGDSNTASSGQAAGYNGKGINVGNDFDAYRFTGQWNAVANNDNVTVNVGVGMMTDSGEVLAKSNDAPYGNAKAYYTGSAARTTDADGVEAPFTASDNSFVRTSVRDASNSPVKLNASAQNFIGWYYYDANTGDFVKANYAGNENFYPNYSNKDVTFYAMYRASAVYNFNYIGREGARTYSASGEDLTEAEMGNGNKIDAASHEADIKNKVPVGIGIFKQTIDFSPTSYSSWTKTADENGYVLDISGFVKSAPTYTLTVWYKDAEGDLVSVSDEAKYNGKAVDLKDGEYENSKGDTKEAGVHITSYYDKPFLGWYSYDNATVGTLLSSQANYGMQLTRHQSIIALYDEDENALPDDGWKAYIDENVVNKELTTKNTGVYYNDTIVRVRNGSDVRATLPENSKIGVLVVCDNKTNETINTYTRTQLNSLVAAISPGNTRKTAKGLSITNMQASSQTGFNRTDIAIRSDYAKTLGSKYCVYAYFYDGSTQTYHFSAVSDVKTYE